PSIADQLDPRVVGVYAVLNQFNPASVPSLPNVPATQQTIWQVDPNLQIPTVFVIGSQVERQLPHNTTMTVGFYNIRITHVIRARDVTARLRATINKLIPNVLLRAPL